MITPVTISEKLLFSTVRIETKSADGTTGTGTGFFFNFKLNDGRFVPTIITNKHVVKNATSGSFQLHEKEGEAEKQKPSGKFFTVTIDDFEKHWIGHPNPDVDLCAMFAQPLVISAEQQGKQAYFIGFDEPMIPQDSILQQLSAVEDALMVGYPIGLWDNVNNIPIMRKGTTATHPAMDFCGKSITVLDIPCFPGSSGSPVLIVNEGMFATKNGTAIGSRALLLGVLYAGPQLDLEGQIEICEIPTVKRAISHTRIMVNLGYAIKAKEINVLGQIIKDTVLSHESQNNGIRS